jgi:succinyl-CoA synthetase alpha subunit
MATAQRILRSRYVDSVVLMRLAQALEQETGVEHAAALMGTAANLALLRAGGFVDGACDAAPDDLVVAVTGGSADAVEAALSRVDALLAAPASARDGLRTASDLESAVALQPGSNIAAISLPGEYAAAEARRALEQGLHVFLFSSNVSLDDELSLKRLASERGLLCMGPDCGTAIVAGAGLGFANVVRPGPVGIVGASGTGIQEVSCLLDRFGVGISHALGCGSRDLSAAVGGVTAFAALEALLDDPATKAVVVLSKPPDPAVADRLRERAANASKRVVLDFLGEDGTTLEELARRAAIAAGASPAELDETLPEAELAALRERLGPSRHFLRGLYAGGTLAYETQLVLRETGLTVASNAPLADAPRLRDARRSEGHTVVDLGSEEFTRGRPHPMIDSRERCARIVQEADDPETAVILLDVVLGYGAAADPAGDLADAVRTAAARVPVLAHVCGTEGDPQGLAKQERTLQEAGALLLPTNAALARTGAAVLAATGAVR